MKIFSSISIAFACVAISIGSFAQNLYLQPGQTIEKKLLKGETHRYTFQLLKGEYATCIVMQKGIDLAIDLTDPTGKKIKTFDSPNGNDGPEPIEVEATENGDYQLHVYHFAEENLNNPSTGVSEGNYSITGIAKLSATGYQQKLEEKIKDKKMFSQWIINNAHPIKTVDAGNGFEDLQFFKPVLKGVNVVGLGEASHGTSEFFRMKHRMLEFLVKEMGFTSFYIEASMTRCRYVNDYLLHGKGNLDTATVIQGFIPWRVEEVRNMIEWMKKYNETMPDEKKVKFFGYDLQINNLGWKALKEMDLKINPLKVAYLDSLRTLFDSANSLINSRNKANVQKGSNILKSLKDQCSNELNLMIAKQNEYENAVGKDEYEENLMNMKLITQEIESYKDGYNDRRDYYMAQNILYLLNREKPGTKVFVWAHNGHIGKTSVTENAPINSMGGYLNTALKSKYYAIGFEFYSGSFQTRNLDINNNTANWDIMSVGEPPAESLPWYFNKVEKDKFYIDFKNTGADKVKNFLQDYEAHSFGSSNSSKWPQTYSSKLTNYDGMIYIKTSTAATNFNKVMLKRF